MKILLCLISLALLFVMSSCSHSNTYGPYFGKVIDTETKEPIEGAAVLVVFYTDQPGPAGSITRYADAIETVTDKNGEFSIPKHKVISSKFLYFLDSHGYFIIFKPGFGHYPDSKGVKPMFVPNGTIPEKQIVIVELPRLTSMRQMVKEGSPVIRHEIPYAKQKKYIELINEWNSLTGIHDKEKENTFGEEAQ